VNRKRRGGGHVNHERWLVSYADFITLLFAFFVVLFSSSQMDKRKVGKLSNAIQEAFQELGVFQTATSRTPLVPAESVPTENLDVVEQNSGMPASLSLEALQKQLNVALKPELEKHEVVMRRNRDGLVISLEEMGFFDSGSAELRPGSETAVQRIADALRAQPNNIRIEGHTDNVPIHTPQFKSNWELSTARATEMIRVFLTVYNLPATRLSAAGYAEFHPTAGNDTPEGRAQNRRVDIVVLAH
jgi:chemotaxis protein MotB